jgi:hypothetical protein
MCPSESREIARRVAVRATARAAPITGAATVALQRVTSLMRGG